MSDTIGSCVDKLCTCTNKMFMAQEDFYSIRRMSFDEFKVAFSSEEGLKKLYDFFKKSSDLNLQRQALILEVDKKIVEIVTAIVKGEGTDNGSFIQDQHKTY